MRNKILIYLVLAVVVTGLTPTITSAASIVGWGYNNYGQATPPAGNNYIAISAFWSHSLGLKQDGSIVAWGWNDYGQCDIPSPNSGFIAIAAGECHSLGLKQDGSIVAWGSNYDEWGNWTGQATPPADSGFIAIIAGGHHSLGLKQDGSIVAWGRNYEGQCNIPSPNSGFIAISAGGLHSLGLKQDGSIVAWGRNPNGQCDIPSPNSGFIAISAGSEHSLGLKQEGSIVAWGWNGCGQCDIPSPNSAFIAINAGSNGDHNLGLKQDGSIVAWGRNDYGQCNIPSPNSGFISIAAGACHSLALKLQNNPPAADAGEDQVVYADGNFTADITLDGSDSNDPNGDELTYKWTWTIDGQIYDAEGVSPTIELPVGEHAIELIVNDGEQDSQPDQVVIVVIAPMRSDLCVFPQIINRNSKIPNNIMALVRLPAGISKDQIDEAQRLIFYPGGIEAAWQQIFQYQIQGVVHTNILALFDKAKLMEAVPNNGSVELKVVGRLKSGQYFYGTDTVRIIIPGIIH